MKYLLTLCVTLVLLTSCSNNSTMASQFSSFKSRFFKSETDKQTELVLAAIRDGNLEKAELEISQIANPFHRAKALGQVAHYQIIEKNDLIGAKKIAEKLEITINDIASKEDKLFSQIQLADLKHFIDKSASQELLKKVHSEIWSIVSPEERSRLLIRLIALQLETQRDVPTAKQTIEQTKQTIEFIQKDSLKVLRIKELDNLLFVNNHILSQDL